MATQFGQTGFYHEDYKVQREFERVHRMLSKGSEVATIESNGGEAIESTPEGQNGTTGLKWALTVKWNNTVVNDPKVVQALNFLNEHVLDPEGVIQMPVEFKIYKNQLEKLLSTDDKAVQMNILATAVTSLTDWMMYRDDARNSVVHVNIADVVGGIFTNLHRRYIQLVNDEESPGANKYYGTSEMGTKGFHPLPMPGSYRHIQTTPALVWNIYHGLQKYPGGVTSYDMENNQIVGIPKNITNIHLIITYLQPVTGYADVV